MPNPNKYKDEKEFMRECMHTTLHMEKKDRDNAIAQCLNQWRNRKKCVAELLRELSANLVEGKYIREKGHGTPGEPGYKPTLWYMKTPGGKKVLVDQKASGG
jgi:hypothetical protein